MKRVFFVVLIFFALKIKSELISRLFSKSIIKAPSKSSPIMVARLTSDFRLNKLSQEQKINVIESMVFSEKTLYDYIIDGYKLAKSKPAICSKCAPGSAS